MTGRILNIVKSQFEDEIDPEYTSGFDLSINDVNNDRISDAPTIAEEVGAALKEIKESKNRQKISIYQRDSNFVVLPSALNIPLEFKTIYKACNDTNRSLANIMKTRLFLWAAIYLIEVEKSSIDQAKEDSPKILTLWKKQANDQGCNICQYVNNNIAF